MWAFLLLPLLASSHPLDDYYRSTARPYTAAEERFSEGPQIPFTNFSKDYVQQALALPLVDWNAQGAVTPVKSQAGHGFCGTFGRVGSAESQWVLRGGGPLTSFSEQMLISCVGWDKDQAAFFEPNGFMSTASYPYNLSDYPDVDPPIPGNPCRFDPKQVVPGTSNFFQFRTGQAPNEDQLAAFVHHNGPVSAGIDASVFALRQPGCEARGDCFINATACATGTVMDHSIQLTGYGTDAAMGPFWIVKNSWSTRFANGGFIYIARGVGCGSLCSDPSICGNVFGHGDPSSYYE